MKNGFDNPISCELNDIAKRIKEEIYNATKPKPKKVLKEDYCIKVRPDRFIAESAIRCKEDFIQTYDGCVNYYNSNEDTVCLESGVKDGERFTTFKDKKDGSIIEITEIKRYEFEDEGYYPEYSQDTLDMFNEIIDIMQVAGVCSENIERILSGKCDEAEFKDRLKSELKELNINSL